MKKQLLYLVSGLVMGVSATLLLSHQAVGDDEQPRSAVPSVVTSPQVPTSVDFAGQTIDISRADLHERMDREILAFTYSHQLTMLMLKRANRIFPIVEPLLKECGVPDDLKYLMVIESNLDPGIVSRAGAAGLWQFMPATGREYGLEVNDNIDERYHIEKATRAACSYLKKQYRQFGDWMTVAASYNGGPGGVKSKQAAQGVESAMDMYLVEETSRYMFRILTAKLVFSDPRRYGFVLRSEDLYPYIPPKDTVTVTKPITDLAAFARQHGVTFAQLKNENLWLRESSLNNKSGRTYSLKIPDGKALFYNPRETKAHDRRWVINR
ncbi:MAG: lytic transglycosylase domain-containing protein [Bacteroidaceae bacterium]|nr:lytic transglycosylase domain-containing protein [Bacteroidaceae bacterium]